ncbi:hypothetical protein [Nitrosomonas aestuarii]|uniref:hypothetical protein n=1 Tax=Nitrosomonas aestuarii TaxID=52441 RepID=UPI000D4DBE57|nr:hypothetical protein C8R11_13116 [Nitrosomonas aestuarii]
MQRTCDELGIGIIFADSPQGKGRIERSFNTFQDRLISELRLNKIKDMDNANRYFQDVFIPTFWRSHIQVISKNDTSEFTSIPEHINLENICCLERISENQA